MRVPTGLHRGEPADHGERAPDRAFAAVLALEQRHQPIPEEPVHDPILVQHCLAQHRDELAETPLYQNRIVQRETELAEAAHVGEQDRERLAPSLPIDEIQTSEQLVRRAERRVQTAVRDEPLDQTGVPDGDGRLVGQELEHHAIALGIAPFRLVQYLEDALCLTAHDEGYAHHAPGGGMDLVIDPGEMTADDILQQRSPRLVDRAGLAARDRHLLLGGDPEIAEDPIRVRARCSGEVESGLARVAQEDRRLRRFGQATCHIEDRLQQYFDGELARELTAGLRQRPQVVDGQELLIPRGVGGPGPSGLRRHRYRTNVWLSIAPS